MHEDEGHATLMLIMISVPKLELLEELRQLYVYDKAVQALVQKYHNQELGPKYSYWDGLLYYKHRLYITNRSIPNYSIAVPLGGTRGSIKPSIACEDSSFGQG